MATMLINTISFVIKETEPSRNAVVEYRDVKASGNPRNTGHFSWRSVALATPENVPCL